MSLSNYKIWLQELGAIHDIEDLLEKSKDRKISRRKRKAALERARELSMCFFGENTFDSCGSDRYVESDVNVTTDSDNSSVSSVSEVSSDSEDTKELLGERFYLNTPSGWHDYLCLLDERKEEKKSRRKLQKREDKRALIAVERRRWAEEQRHQALQQEFRILDLGSFFDSDADDEGDD